LVANLLQQLETKEAVLLMYLADELPPHDRVEVERMLAADPAMRQELERVRAAHAAFVGAMPALDRATRLPVPQAIVVRRVVRAMRQWQAKRVARQAPAPAVAPLRFPWWTYPVAAAASLLIAFLVWWGNSEQRERPVDYVMRGPAPYETTYASNPAMDLALAWEMGDTVEEPDEARSLVEPSDYNIFFLSIDDADGVTTPKSERPDPALDDDDIYL
jgi:hypothetical protein